VPVQLLVLVVLAGLATPTASQSVTSIQGVWRVVERTIPASTADRRDPFGAFSQGTHTDLQPELMIFTAKHYSRTTDTARSPDSGVEKDMNNDSRSQSLTLSTRGGRRLTCRARRSEPIWGLRPLGGRC